MNKRNLKELRKQAGMTQKEMAEAFGIPLRNIENWEMGVRKTPEWAERLIAEKLREIWAKRSNRYSNLSGNYSAEAKAQYAEIDELLWTYRIRCGSICGGYDGIWYDDAENIICYDRREEIAKALKRDEKEDYISFNEGIDDLDAFELAKKFESEHTLDEYLAKVEGFDFEDCWEYADDKSRAKFISALIDFKNEINQLIELIDKGASLEEAEDYGFSINITNLEELFK